MSRVRVLAGTRKGAFVLTSDGKREKWEVSGPHFAGWELYHLKGSPADPNRIYASQCSGWFGQIIQRSDDGGKTWIQPGTPPGEKNAQPAGPPKGESNKFVYDTSAQTGKPLTTHMWYDGTQHPWEFKRVWHLEPSPTDPDTVYAGVEDAGLFRSTDGGKNWHELSGLRGHGTGPNWQPGAGGMCLHTVILIPSESTSPSRPRALSVPTTAASPGSQSTRVCIPNTFPTPMPKSAIAFTTWPCTRRARTCSLCKSTGMSCAATTPATPGKKSAATCRPTSALSSMSTRTSRRPSTSCPSRATGSTSLSTANCVCTAARAAGTSGKHLPTACRKATAT